MRSSVLAVGLVALVLLLAQAAFADGHEITPAEALERILTADELSEDWFSPLVLQQISLDQLAQIIAQLTQGLGEFQGVAPSGQQFLASYERGDIPTTIVLDAEGRIITIFFQPPRLRVSGLDDATASFEGLPGQVSLLILSNKGELAAIQPDVPLAVGSAFKLAVLAALETKVQLGELKWEDVVRLDEAWRSLPSGVVQTWPAGSPVTLHTLALQMISISDNTATDAIISIVGREFVELFSPRNAPFLTTREAFVLKDPDNAQLLERYRSAGVLDRRAILEELKGLPLPDISVFSGSPAALDVEWYLSARELCGLMSAVRHLDIFSVNPGLAAPEDWERVAFKGGSEPGVLNLTTWLEQEDGDVFCISATWNNPAAALDELQFFSAYTTLIEAIKEL